MKRKKRALKLPPRESAYETLSLAEVNRRTAFGTTQPDLEGVKEMREWSEENQK